MQHDIQRFPTARVGGRVSPFGAGLPDGAIRFYDPSPTFSTAALPTPTDLCLAVFDEIDHGLVVLGSHGEVRFANRAAWRACADTAHPVHIRGGQLEFDSPQERRRILAAVDAAIAGRRSLVDVGQGDERHCVALVPLALGTAVPSVLMILGRQGRHDVVALQLFAKTHGLTAAETSVLIALSEGLRPKQIAERHGVAICTVRTQIRDMRIKTDTESISALLRLIGRLPPMALSTGQPIARAA